MKGHASDVLRRLGSGISVEAVMNKLQSTFGSIETEETALRKFYSRNRMKVSVHTHQGLKKYLRAMTFGGIKKDDGILKKVFYQGLKPTIKHLAFSKCDLIEDYDRFKIEVRKQKLI